MKRRWHEPQQELRGGDFRKPGFLRKAISCVASAAMVVAFAPTIAMPATAFADGDSSYSNSKGVPEPNNEFTYEETVPDNVSNAYSSDYTTIGRIPVGVDCESNDYPNSQPTFKLRYSAYLYYGVKDTKLTVFSINDLGTDMPDYNYEDQGYYAVKDDEGQPTGEIKEIFGSNNATNGKFNFYYDGYGIGEAVESIDEGSNSSKLNHQQATGKVILNNNVSSKIGYSTSKTLCWRSAAWYNNSALKNVSSVEVANSVTRVGKLNFANVDNVTSYKIDNSNCKFGCEAFFSLNKLPLVIELADGISWNQDYLSNALKNSVTVTNSAVESFKATYADILAKQPGSALTTDEQTKLEEALAAYDELSDNAKELLTPEYETLQLLGAKDYGTTTESTVPSTVANAYSEYGTISRVPTGAVYENGKLVQNYRSDLFYGVKDDGNGGKAWTVFSIKPGGSDMPDYNYECQGYAKDSNGKYVEIFSPTNTGTVKHNDGKSYYDFYYKSDPSKPYSSVEKTNNSVNHAAATKSLVVEESGAYSSVGYSTSDVLCYASAPWWTNKNTISSLTFDESINKIGKLNIVYNLSSAPKFKTIEIKNRSCKFSSEAIFSQSSEAGMTLVAAYSATSATDSNWNNARNSNAQAHLAISYTEARDFKAKYSELWNLDASTASDDERAKAVEALNEHNTFAQEIKDQLKDENAKLIALTHNGAATSGSIGNINWTITDNGSNGYKLAITGTGQLELNSTAAPWSSFANQITDVILGEGITGIGDSLFADLSGLETVDMCKTIEENGIADSAFPKKEFTIKGWYNHAGVRSYLAKHGQVKLKLKELRVLAIGNSHTQDYTTFLGNTLSAMKTTGVDTKVTVQTIIAGGRKASEWLDGYETYIGNRVEIQDKTYDLVIFQDYQESTIPSKKEQLVEDMKFLIAKAKGTFGNYAKYAWFADWVDTLAIENDPDKLGAAYASSAEAMSSLVNAEGGVNFVIPASTVALNAAKSYLGTTKNAEGALKNWDKVLNSEGKIANFDHADNYWNADHNIEPNNGDTRGEYGPLSYYNLLFRDRTHMSLEVGRQLMVEAAVYGILNGFGDQISYADGKDLASAFNNAKFTAPSFGTEDSEGCYWEGSIDDAPEIWGIYKTAVTKSYASPYAVTTTAADYTADPLQSTDTESTVNDAIARAFKSSSTPDEFLNNVSSEVSKLVVGGSTIRLASASLDNVSNATCANKAKCTLNLTLRRGYSTRTFIFTNVEIGAALGHEMAKHDAVAATCTADGNIEYWTCNTCGKKFSDDQGTTEIADDKIVVKAHHTLTAHAVVAATCGKAGNTDYWSCDVCKKLFSDANATKEIALKDTVIAATDKHSYKNGTCSVCGAKDPNYSTGGGSYVPTPTPKPDEPSTPDTPDTPQAPAKGDFVVVGAGTGQLHFAVTNVADATGKGGTVSFAACNGNATSVNVPATVEINGVAYAVTEIAPYAFKNCKRLKKVTMAGSITKVGKGAFENCKSLKSVTLGTGVKTIAKSAFKGCKSLTSITVTSKHLSKKSVKGCLKGSAVKTVVVKVGSKKANKSYAKKYAKLFTKKVAGKKASVKASKKPLKK